MNTYKFTVNEENYTFDGNNILIYEGEKVLTYHKPKEIDEHKSKFFNSLGLVLSKECNLKCSYCYVNNFKKIDFEYAQRAILFLSKSLKKYNHDRANITFFGGEPLLEFTLIKKLVQYSNTILKNINIKYGIVTNGTLLNDDVVDFLKEHKFKVVISLDGCKEDHDINRKYKENSKGTYEDIINKINTYKKELSISCRLTVTNNNYDLYKNINSIKKTCNLKNIIFGIDSNINKDSLNKFLISFRSVCKKYYDDIMKENYYIIKNITGIIYNIVMRQKNRSHCNAGIAYFAVSNDKYCLCHRLVGNNIGFNPDDLNSIENEITKFDNYLKKDVGERFTTCVECPFKYLCGGMCYHHAININGELLHKDIVDCTFKKVLIKESIKLITKLPLNKRRDFLMYLIDSYSH